MASTDTNEILTLSIRRQFKASVDAVFKAWTDAEQVSQWFAPTAGFSVKVPLMDVQAGGKYRIEMTNPDGETYIAVGEYIEVSEPSKVVFTWAWEGGDEGMRVTLDFQACKGGTELILTHEQFPDAGSRDHHDEGWTGCLAGLEKFLA